MAVCKACGAEIIWIEMESGKHMPCDVGLVEYWDGLPGKSVLITDKGKVKHCNLSGYRKPDGLGRKPHWQTCPYAENFRKR